MYFLYPNHTDEVILKHKLTFAVHGQYFELLHVYNFTPNQTFSGTVCFSLDWITCQRQLPKAFNTLTLLAGFHAHTHEMLRAKQTRSDTHAIFNSCAETCQQHSFSIWYQLKIVKVAQLLQLYLCEMKIANNSLMWQNITCTVKACCQKASCYLEFK